MSLNKVMLIGNVGKDPEVRYLENNSPNSGNAKVAQFTLATTERYRDRNGELRENTEWHNIVAWRNSADIAEKYIRKGTQVYIEGKLRTRSWTDQTGGKRYTTEITVDTIQLLGRKSDNPAAQDGARPAQQPYAPQGGQAYGQPAQAQQPYQQNYQSQPAQNYRSAAQPQQQEPLDISLGNAPEDDLPF